MKETRKRKRLIIGGGGAADKFLLPGGKLLKSETIFFRRVFYPYPNPPKAGSQEAMPLAGVDRVHKRVPKESELCSRLFAVRRTTAEGGINANLRFAYKSQEREKRLRLLNSARDNAP